MKAALLLIGALFAGHAALAQAPTFVNGWNADGTSLDRWKASYWWAPDGYAAPDMSSWWVNPGYGPTSAPDADPFSVVGGVLTIAVKPTPADVSPSAVGGRKFVSGLLQTKASFSQLYGYFEVVAQMSAAPGTMSAFWLLPANGSWPPEIDVFEVLADQQTMLASSAHTRSGLLLQGLTTVPTMTAGFHTYAVDWTAETIRWSFDGRDVYQIPTPADMHQPMYLLLDVAAGAPGSWEGAPKSRSETGAMRIKSVRVYPSKPRTSAIDTRSPANTPELD